jgi:hypothetical protein
MARDRMISILLNEAEYAKLERLRADTGCSRSDVFRRMLNLCEMRPDLVLIDSSRREQPAEVLDTQMFEGTTCNGPQTRSLGLANKGDCEPTIRANTRGREPTLSANKPRLIAISPQTAPRTQIHCIQDWEGIAVQEKSGHQFNRTHIVRFICGHPDIHDWGKGAFSPDTGGRCDEEAAWQSRVRLARRACRIFAATVG